MERLAQPGSTSDVWIDGGKTGAASLVTLSGSASVRNLTVDLGDGLTLGNGARLTVYGSALAIDGSLNLAGTSSYTGLLLAGDTVLTGTGTTTLGGSVNFVSRSGASTTKLTIDSGYTVRGSGYLGYDPTTGAALGSIINRGSVIAEGGTLNLYGNFSGPGSIAVKAGATLHQQGGNVQTALLDLSAGGTYVLSGTLEADAVKGN